MQRMGQSGADDDLLGELSQELRVRSSSTLHFAVWGKIVIVLILSRLKLLPILPFLLLILHADSLYSEFEVKQDSII